MARTIVMTYEFWDVRTKNLLGAFESKDKAIQALRNAVHQDGAWVVEFVMLLEDDAESGHKNLLGVGSELLFYIRDAA
jgi:hypothetical protein